MSKAYLLFNFKKALAKCDKFWLQQQLIRLSFAYDVTISLH